MVVKPNPPLPVPIHRQLVEPAKHAIEAGVLRLGG